jgi:hypothetical protein
MAYFVGVVLALVVFAFAVISGFDRGRSFYPTVAIVVPSYYALFAVIGAPGRILVIEVAITLVFLVVAVVGFKTTLWLAAAAIAGHGLFDFVHHVFIYNPGMPIWWPAFCGTFDVVFGAAVAFRLMRDSRLSRLPA